MRSIFNLALFAAVITSAGNALASPADECATLKTRLEAVMAQTQTPYGRPTGVRIDGAQTPVAGSVSKDFIAPIVKRYLSKPITSVLPTVQLNQTCSVMSLMMGKFAVGRVRVKEFGPDFFKVNAPAGTFGPIAAEVEVSLSKSSSDPKFQPIEVRIASRQTVHHDCGGTITDESHDVVVETISFFGPAGDSPATLLQEATDASTVRLGWLTDVAAGTGARDVCPKAAADPVKSLDADAGVPAAAPAADSDAGPAGSAS